MPHGRGRGGGGGAAGSCATGRPAGRWAAARAAASRVRRRPRRGGGGGRRAGGLLNARLSAARSCDDMLPLHAQMQSSMDIRHLALWPKLASASRSSAARDAPLSQWTRAHAAGLDALIAQTGARPATFARAGASPRPRARGRRRLTRPPPNARPPPQRIT